MLALFLSPMTRMLTKDEFEDELGKYGFSPTDGYSKDGTSRRWRTHDGQTCYIPVYDEYPIYILERILQDLGRYFIPIYGSNL